MDVDNLLSAAADGTGLDDFGDGSYREGLEALVASLVDDARLSEVGTLALESQIVANLANRLRVVDWWAAHPELAEERIERPVFIVGLPRTGTTLLSYLLDCDDGVRSLMRWEAMSSVPPPQRATFTTDPRIDATRESSAMLDALNPGFKAIHYEAPDGPTECVAVFSQEFKSVLWETVANVPGYSSWLLAADHTSAYRYHRRLLQLLQSGAPGQWVLKSPGHRLAPDVLLETYPDASIVVTHRDPVTVVASVCSLVRSLSGTFSDADHGAYVNEHWTALVEEMIRRVDAVRDGDPDADARILDVGYDELVRSPLAVVERVYEHAGRDLDGAAVDAMAAYLEGNRQGTHGRHTYSLDELGLDGDELRHRFAGYRERYLV